jgi:hypothetical protein
LDVIIEINPVEFIQIITEIIKAETSTAAQKSVARSKIRITTIRQKKH